MWNLEISKERMSFCRGFSSSTYHRHVELTPTLQLYMTMRRIFWGFCRNRFLMSPLHYFSSCSDFGFEFTEIFIFEKRLPTITDAGESPTPCITDMRSRRLRASPIQRVGYWIFLKKTLCINDKESRRLPAPVIWWVANSLYRWVGESLTPRITDMESQRLRVSLSWGVDDSTDQWHGELLFKEKINLVSIFRAFNG